MSDPYYGLRWRSVPVEETGGVLLAVLERGTGCHGWIVSKTGTAYTACLCPLGRPSTTKLNALTDGEFIGVYDDARVAMEVTLAKCVDRINNMLARQAARDRSSSGPSSSS